jgi:hypothetical protein
MDERLFGDVVFACFSLPSHSIPPYNPILMNPEEFLQDVRQPRYHWWTGDTIGDENYQEVVLAFAMITYERLGALAKGRVLDARLVHLILDSEFDCTFERSSWACFPYSSTCVGEFLSGGARNYTTETQASD